MSSHQTVEIIGGGLAGLSLALGLRARHVPVRLFETDTYPRHRVCGEFITGLDPATQEQLQLGHILAKARPAQTVLWSESGYSPLRHRLPEPALCLSRHRLDALMAEALTTAGGELLTGQRMAPDPRPGRILACGRRPDKRSPWIGLKQHFTGLKLSHDLELYLGRGAYVGATQVEDSTVNICGLFPRHSSGRDHTLLGRLRQAGIHTLADQLEKARPRPGSACAVAGLNYGDNPSSPASVGDHQGLIPPFTGHGMTVALQSAATALPHLVAWSRGETPWPNTLEFIERDLATRFRRRLAWGRRLHPWLLSPIRRRVIHRLHSLKLLPLGPLYRLCH